MQDEADRKVYLDLLWQSPNWQPFVVVPIAAARWAHRSSPARWKKKSNAAWHPENDGSVAT
jgi:hypothetical protein